MAYLIYLVAIFVFGYFVLYLALMASGISFVVAAVATAAVPLIDAAASSYRRFGGAAPIEGLGLEPPTDPAVGDPGYRGYIFGPAYREAALAGREASAAVLHRCVQWLEWIKRTVRDRPFHGRWRFVTAFPIGLAAQAGMLVGAVAGAVPVLAIGLVFALYLGLLGMAALAVGLGLAVVERGFLFVRGITVECPQCHQRVRNPLYRCSGDGGCDALHRALVPGTRGVLHRICRCGRRLPTLLLLGKQHLVAQCPSCGNAQLPINQQTAPTVHIAVAGGPQVGKSVFMFAAVKRLHDEWRREGSGDHFWADEEFMATFAGTERSLGDPQSMLKTVIAPPRAYTLYQGRGLRRRLLYLYDAAGEIFHSSDHLAAATFFNHVKGVVLCVDPFSIPAVHRRMTPAALAQVRSPVRNPRDAVELVAGNLREHIKVGRSNRLPLPAAVVLTKADGFDLTDVEHPYAACTAGTRGERDTAVRRWLTDVAGQADIERSITANFERVSFFVVSHREAVDDTAHARRQNDDPADPISWLLDPGSAR